jgi:hypothetical protein
VPKADATAPLSAAEAAQRYLNDVSKVRATGRATTETSYYPQVNGLLTALGRRARPRRSALNQPRGIDGNFPDVALYEDDSNVLVMPVEAKGVDVDLGALVVSAQARRYATSFGGGRVLVTNLRGFAVGEIDSTGTLVERDRVDLVTDERALDARRPALLPGSAERLAALLDAWCSTRAALRDPQLVARLLAYHGRRLTEAIEATPDWKTLLAPIVASLRDGLEVELPKELLVPTVVQTFIYGLFAAWLESDDPQDFQWVDATYRLSMPVYADMLHEILTPAFVRRFGGPGTLTAAARVLTWVDRDAFNTAFEGGAIEYFYEPFLAQFDPDLRDRLGVWYTPAAIAEYQVARVDHHLRTDLGIERGLADPSVVVLDPAVGTGTYLAAVLRHIHRSEIARGEPASIAAEHARAAVRDRLIGFEVLPAASDVSPFHDRLTGCE